MNSGIAFDQCLALWLTKLGEPAPVAMLFVLAIIESTYSLCHEEKCDVLCC
jgi:hypothetical protein